MSAALSYVPSPIRRARRSKANIIEIKDAILQVLDEDHPMTVRGVFYRCVSLGVIDKTETEYKRTICRLVLEMRRDGEVPYSWIADGTRLMRKPQTHDSMESALEYTAQTYRRALWNDQNAYVEIWSEKDAIGGILLDATWPWDVPLMVARGYASETFLYSAAENIRETRKPTWIYFFGDHDPSGVDIRRSAEKRLREFAPESDINFVTAAVTPEQIAEWNLPTRPTKANDTRARHFTGDSVDVDAIPPRVLRALVRDCIEQHIDGRALEQTRAIEKAERETLANLARRPT